MFVSISFQFPVSVSLWKYFMGRNYFKKSQLGALVSVCSNCIEAFPMSEEILNKRASQNETLHIYLKFLLASNNV